MYTFIVTFIFPVETEVKGQNLIIRISSALVYDVVDQVWV